MDSFVKVANVADIQDRRGKTFLFNNTEVAVFNVDGVFYAIENLCPHQHTSLLHEGNLDGLAIECPLHGWKFRIDSGKPMVGSGRLKTFAVKIEMDEIVVDLHLIDSPC
jgi:nitrite reductase/ring-hydroxylating ferredoxin subunit